jgi:hypothetical protein
MIVVNDYVLKGSCNFIAIDNPITFEFYSEVASPDRVQVKLTDVRTGATIAEPIFSFFNSVVYVDVSAYLRSYLKELKHDVDYSAFINVDEDVSIKFKIGYREALEGLDFAETYTELSQTYQAVKAVRQQGEGINLNEYFPETGSKARFLTMFEKPKMWEGFPFSLSFLNNFTATNLKFGNDDILLSAYPSEEVARFIPVGGNIDVWLDSDLSKPASPTNLTATETSYQTVSLDWVSTDADGTTFFQVHRSSVEAFTADASTLIADQVTTTTFVDSSVTAGTTYYYRAIAYRSNLFADNESNEVSIRVSDKIAEPTQLLFSEVSVWLD